MSFLPAYPAYRESGVARLGAVPGGWKITRLRFVARFNPSKSETAGLPPETEVSFLPMDAIGEDGSVRLDATRALAAVEQGYTYFRDGDVVIAKITPCFENGKGALVSGLLGGVGFGTTELIVVRPHEGRAIGPYLHWLFVSPDFRNTVTAAMYGAGGQKRVPDEFVRDFMVALPPPAEQSAIAAFLDRETGKIDALVAEQERLIALLKEKRQAVISQAVTKGLDPNAPMKDSGVEWLGLVPAAWDVKRVKHVARLESGHTPSKQFPEYWEDGDIEWVSLNDSKHLAAHDYISETAVRITKLGMENSSARLLPGGAVVFTRDATIGLAAITAKPMAVSQHLIAWCPSAAILDRYLLRVFNVMKPYLDAFTFGATIKTIGMPDVRKLMTPVPPVEEQQRIIDFVDKATAKLDALTTEAERTIGLLKERRAALISAAVTGKIDVRGLVPDVQEAA